MDRRLCLCWRCIRCRLLTRGESFLLPICSVRFLLCWATGDWTPDLCLALIGLQLNPDTPASNTHQKQPESSSSLIFLQLHRLCYPPWHLDRIEFCPRKQIPAQSALGFRLSENLGNSGDLAILVIEFSFRFIEPSSCSYHS